MQSLLKSKGLITDDQEKSSSEDDDLSESINDGDLEDDHPSDESDPIFGEDQEDQ